MISCVRPAKVRKKMLLWVVIVVVFVVVVVVVITIIVVSSSSSLYSSVHDTVFLLQGPGPNHEPSALEGCFVLVVT